MFPEPKETESGKEKQNTEKGSSSNAADSLWTFLFTNLGLVLTAFIQTGNQKLTLFQALEVTNLLWRVVIYHL